VVFCREDEGKLRMGTGGGEKPAPPLPELRATLLRLPNDGLFAAVGGSTAVGANEELEFALASGGCCKPVFESEEIATAGFGVEGRRGETCPPWF
jgi:hypothetical protein